MRMPFCLIAAYLIAVCLSMSTLAASLEPERGSVAGMETPGAHSFITIGFMGDGGNIFDADSGEMQGKVLVSDYTSAAVLDRNRNRIYVPAT